MASALGWTLLFLSLGLVKPQCFVCSRPQCLRLSPLRANLSTIVYIRCNTTDSQLASFIESNSFEGVSTLILRTPLLLDLNFNKLTDVTVIDLSQNQIETFNLTELVNVQSLNLSHNLLKEFDTNLTQIVRLDLSHNNLQRISDHKLPKLLWLNLGNNDIKNISNFSFGRLKYLDLSNNKVAQLELGSMPNLKTLNLSNNSIETISNLTLSLMPNLEELNLSFNLVRELRDANFKLPSLLKLDLKQNRLVNLSPKCFSGLNRLQLLDISGNKIAVISPSTLQYVPGLVQLVVSGNEGLSSEDFGLLLATRRLQEVDASQTGQVRIPASLTRSVKHLRLFSNAISSVECGDLDSYPLLDTLDLARNNISFIEDDALGRLELLTTLRLSSNALSAIPHTLPAYLKHLYLDHNEVRSISSNDFNGLSQLEILDLSFNKIITISDGTFLPLKSIQQLNLSGNTVEILSSSTFLGTHRLRVLDLSCLRDVTKCEQPLCFPVPETNQLQELYLQQSPTLVSRLMNDVAALKTLKQLNILNLSNSSLSEMRKDLPNLLPRINVIYLQGNELNCSELFSTQSFLHKNIKSDCNFPDGDSTTQMETFTTEEVSETSMFPDDLGINLTTLTDLENIGYFTFEVINSSSTTVLDLENNTELINLTKSGDTFEKDLWYKESSPGLVYAFSSEMPTSHPGLFVMLLLPIALVSTCLIINYSRMKNNRNIEMGFDQDVEISNFSNELW